MSYNQFEFTDYDEAYDEDPYDSDPFELVESSPVASSFRIPNIAMRRAMKPTRLVPYKGSATLDTPAGRADVALPSDLVSKSEFKALEARVLANNRAILGSGRALGTLGVNTKKLDQGLRNNAALSKKKFAAIQQGQMLSALLPPKLTSFKVTEIKDRNGNIVLDSDSDRATRVLEKDDNLTIANAKFDLMSTLLPMIASGGMGGAAESGSNNMMMPFLLMAMKDEKDGSDKDSLANILPFMLMFMNK